MPRYVNPDTAQFWDITLDDAVIRTHFGALETAGETATKNWPDAARARAEHDRAIAYKLERGFELEGAAQPRPRPARPAKRGPARNAQLERAIANNPDDLETVRVYGDWLSEHGDVRGELIALQTKGHTAAAAQLIDEHREHFLGDLHELSTERLQLTWRNGFIDSARIEMVSGGADADERTAGELLRAIFAHPSGAFVRSLAFGTVEGIEDGMVDYESIPDALGELVPAHVSAIDIGDWVEWEVSWSRLGNASGFWKLPALRDLTIRAGSMELDVIESPTLRSLSIITGGLTFENLESIVLAKLPVIESLSIFFGSQYYGATCAADDVLPLLEKKLPTLRHLGLANAEFTDDICAPLAKSPLLRQLKTLDLSRGTLSSAGVQVLVAHRAAFAHLESLDVSNNWLSPADLAQLTGIARQVVTESQRTADEGEERYVTLGE